MSEEGTVYRLAEVKTAYYMYKAKLPAWNGFHLASHLHHDLGPSAATPYNDTSYTDTLKSVHVRVCRGLYGETVQDTSMLVQPVSAFIGHNTELQ